MGFTNSTFLYALILAVVPVIIHLFGIKRPSREVFSPLPVLLRIRKKIIRKKKIHSLILLLLRILLVAGSVMFFAGLFVSYPSASSDFSDGCLILIDNSPSVTVNADGRSVLSRIISSVTEYAARKKNQCVSYTVITLSDRKRFDVLSDNVKSDILRDRISAGPKSVNIERDIPEVLATEKDKRYSSIVLFSDMYSHFVKEISGSLRILKDNNIEIEEIGMPAVSNAFIEHIRVERSQEQRINLIVTVENGGESVFYGSIKLFENESLLDKTTVSLAPSDRTEVSFEIPDGKENIRERFFAFRIEGDDFDYDNTEYFYYREGGKGKILLVNGEPSPDETKSEIFFLSNALKSYFGESVRIYSVLEDMLPETPQLYDIIALANVSGIDDIKAGLLLSYVNEGGKLFISLGSRINIREYNNLDFLPADILGLTEADKNTGIVAEDSLFFESVPDILQGIKRVKLNKFFESKVRKDAKVILKTAGGMPLLVSRGYGKGLVMLYTTSVDMDMNDFPIRKNYLPFVSVLFGRMLEGSSERKIIYAKGKEEVSVRVQECRNGSINITGRKSSEVKVLCKQDLSQRMIISFTAPYENGFYKITEDNINAIMIVNPDKSESVLKRTDISEIKKNLNRNQSSIVSPNIIRDGKMSLVEFLLLLCAVVLLSEMFVMNRR